MSCVDFRYAEELKQYCDSLFDSSQRFAVPTLIYIALRCTLIMLVVAVIMFSSSIKMQCFILLLSVSQPVFSTITLN